MNNPELDLIQIKLLEKHIEYLMGQDMTFENRYKYYENFGMMISLLNDTSFNKFDISHTYRKDIETAVESDSEKEFNEETMDSVKYLIKSQIGTVQQYVEEQKNLL